MSLEKRQLQIHPIPDTQLLSTRPRIHMVALGTRKARNKQHNVQRKSRTKLIRVPNRLFQASCGTATIQRSMLPSQDFIRPAITPTLSCEVQVERKRSWIQVSYYIYTCQGRAYFAYFLLLEYKVRDHKPNSKGPKFFVPGKVCLAKLGSSAYTHTQKVIKVLWPELAGAESALSAISIKDSRFGENIHVKVRWFIVVRVGKLHSTCVYWIP